MEVNRRLNLVLSNGLCVINARVKNNIPIAILFVTDYSDQTRVILDLKEKRILANKFNIEILPKDIDSIIGALDVKK